MAAYVVAAVVVVVDTDGKVENADDFDVAFTENHRETYSGGADDDGSCCVCNNKERLLQ